MVSVTSSQESGSTTSSEWKSRIRSVRAEAGSVKSAPTRKPSQTSALVRDIRPKKRREKWRGRCLRRGRWKYPLTAQTMASGSGRRSGAEADMRNFALCRCGDFEEFARFEVAHSGNHVGRELLDASIEVAHRGVVIAAGVLQRVFDLVECGLQLGEILCSAKLRIS